MKNIKNEVSVVIVLLLAITLASCEINDSTPADPIDPATYPTATFTTDFQGNTVTEGDTIMYQVTLDKPLEHAMTIELAVTGENIDESDYEYEPVTIPAYSLDPVNIPIIITRDDIPEESEDISIALEDEDIETRYTLSPSTEYPSMDLTIENYNDPSGLTVALGWKNHDTDVDMWLNMTVNDTYAAYDGDGDGLILWGTAASSDNPEVLKIPTNDISLYAASGEYYVELDPYHLADGVSTIEYTFSIGYPDQTVEFFEGTFDSENLGSYTADNIDYNYDGSVVWPAYRMLDVTLSTSGAFTVTATN